MEKNICFMECKKDENKTILPLERIKNFKEFHLPLSENSRREQASRCMNCGVPMCQSAIKLSNMVTGCPLHNLIPEWNDALYNGQFDMAAWRLLKTSNFPEFTGRVCPALCEKACNCGNILSTNENNSDCIESVSIRDNELFIIEKAFSTGYMKPVSPNVRSGKKIAVIGSGPAGLAVADMLNRRGHSVTVYERDDRAGGLLMYGIPNMKLDKSIVERRIKFMEAEGVRFVYNVDVGNNYSIDKDFLLSEYDAIALCCGAKKTRPLEIPGANSNGVLYAVDFLKSVTKGLLETDLKDEKYFNPKNKNVLILGGGDTGNDCTGTCIRLEAASVTQLEIMQKPPLVREKTNPWPQWPKVLKTDYGAEEAIAKFGQDPRVFETTIKEIITKDGKVTGAKIVNVESILVDGKRTLREVANSEKIIPADLILIATGFLGCEEYVTKSFDVSLSPFCTVKTENAETYKTDVNKVFVAGDMHRGQSLVVWAIAEGRECAKEIDRFLMGYTNM